MSLSDDDKKAWATITQTITPKKDVRPHVDHAPHQQDASSSMRDYFKDGAYTVPSTLLKQKKDYIHSHVSSKRISKKIVSDTFFHHVCLDPKRVQGMLIEASLDLHEKTLQQAYSDLQQFLEKAQAYRCSCVIVITGKSGALYEKVPRWLQEFPHLLHSFKNAPPQYGGKGALMIHIKR